MSLINIRYAIMLQVVVLSGINFEMCFGFFPDEAALPLKQSELTDTITSLLGNKSTLPEILCNTLTLTKTLCTAGRSISREVTLASSWENCTIATFTYFFYHKSHVLGLFSLFLCLKMYPFLMFIQSGHALVIKRKIRKENLTTWLV